MNCGLRFAHEYDEDLMTVILKLVLARYNTLGWPRDLLHDYEFIRSMGVGTYAYAISNSGGGTHINLAAEATALSPNGDSDRYDYYVLIVGSVRQNGTGPTHIHGTITPVTKEVVIGMAQKEELK